MNLYQRRDGLAMIYIKKFGYHLAPVVCCKRRDVLDPLNLDALPRTSTKELEFNGT